MSSYRLGYLCARELRARYPRIIGAFMRHGFLTVLEACKAAVRPAQRFSFACGVRRLWESRSWPNRFAGLKKLARDFCPAGSCALVPAVFGDSSGRQLSLL
jgi:hypothetical protein